MFAVAPACDGPFLDMTSSPLPAPDAPPTVLVLPFLSTAGDEAAYLAEGVSDELVMALTQVPSLRVVSRGTAAMLRGTYPVRAAVSRSKRGSDATSERLRGWPVLNT